jgi:hypothetical protein
VGGLRVQRINTGYGFWEPTATAVLAYTTEFGGADATYAHSVTVNALLGQTLLIDELRLRGLLPLTKGGEVFFLGSAGYQKGRLLGQDTRVVAHIDSLLLDAGLGWQATKSLAVSLRYQHMRQLSDTRVPPLPFSFIRNTVMIVGTLRYPPESEMPRAYRAPRRVDRSDEINDVMAPSASGNGQDRPSP